MRRIKLLNALTRLPRKPCRRVLASRFWRRHGLASRGAASLATAGCLLPLARQAHAQLLDQYIPATVPGLNTAPGVTVLSRQHPDYNPVNITIGDTEVSPNLSQQFGFDSNVNGTTHGRGSAFSETTGGVGAQNNGEHGSFSTRLDFDSQQYFDVPNQSQTTWDANIGGTRSFGDDTLTAQYYHQNNAENARSLDTPLLDSPIAYRIDDALVSYNAQFSRVSIQPTLEMSYLSYDNGTVLGQPYQQSFLNQYSISPSLIARYQLAPLRNLVFVLRDSTTYFTHRSSFGRGSDDITVLTGIDYAANGVWRFRLLGGYEIRSFTSSIYQTTEAPLVEAEAIWTPTELTTLSGSAARYIENSSEVNAPAYTETDLRLSVDHEYLRNVLLNAHTSLQMFDYSQNGGEQSLFGAGASSTWLVNRQVNLTASYDFTARNTAGQGNTIVVDNFVLGTNYNENRFMLQAGISF